MQPGDDPRVSKYLRTGSREMRGRGRAEHREEGGGGVPSHPLTKSGRQEIPTARLCLHRLPSFAYCVRKVRSRMAPETRGVASHTTNVSCPQNPCPAQLLAHTRVDGDDHGDDGLCRVSRGRHPVRVHSFHEALTAGCPSVPMALPNRENKG